MANELFNVNGVLQSTGILGSTTILSSGEQSATYAEPKPWFRASIKPYLKILKLWVTGQLAGYVPISSKGVANGVAPLNAQGKLDLSFLTVTGLAYKGGWSAATNTPALVDGIGTNGDFYLVQTAGTWNGISFAAGDAAIYNGTIWERVGRDDLVQSVNGKIGAVVLSTQDVAEGGTNLYFTDDRGRAITLTGLSTADASTIVAGDTFLVAIGKLQAQITESAKKTWTDYATMWSAEPDLVGVSTTPFAGDVYRYIWGGTTRYRLVPYTYTPAADTFYAAFAGGTCSQPIISRNEF